MSHIARTLSLGEKQRPFPVRERKEGIPRLEQASETDAGMRQDSERGVSPMKMNTSAATQAHYSPGYKTKTRQKYSLYIDDADLKKLKAYEKNVGVPVSESIRRAIAYYLKNFQK